MQHQLHIVQGVDLAVTTKDSPRAKVKPSGEIDADYFAIGTVGYSLESMLVYILAGERAQVGFPEQVEMIKREARLWRPEEIGIESVQYQAAMQQHLFATTALPVVQVPVTKDLEWRVSMAAPHFESGRIRLRGQMDALVGGMTWHTDLERFVWEYKHFPQPGKGVDDVLTAVLIAVTKALEKMELSQESSMSYKPGAMLGRRSAYADDRSVF